MSVFAAPADDLIALSQSNMAIRRRAQVRTARCGSLRAAGFEVAATFTNPGHYSVVLPDVTPDWATTRPHRCLPRYRRGSRTVSSCSISCPVVPKPTASS